MPPSDTTAKSPRFIQLNFINRSNSMRSSPVVVLQKNSTNPESAIAWQVIQQFRPGDSYQIVFPVINEVSIYDQRGQTSPFMEARPGSAFRMVALPYIELRASGAAHDPQAIEVTNALPQSAIDVNIFKGGAMLSSRQGLNPGETASFVFSSSIFVGVVSSDIEEGQQINSDTLDTINTEISLEGIAGADVVLSGGGNGSDALPFRFSLENVVI